MPPQISVKLKSILSAARSRLLTVRRDGGDIGEFGFICQDDWGVDPSGAGVESPTLIAYSAEPPELCHYAGNSYVFPIRRALNVLKTRLTRAAKFALTIIGASKISTLKKWSRQSSNSYRVRKVSRAKRQRSSRNRCGQWGISQSCLAMPHLPKRRQENEL